MSLKKPEKLLLRQRLQLITERWYLNQLLKVVTQVQMIVTSTEDINAMLDSLRRYAALLNPWARTIGAKMFTEVERRNRQAGVSENPERMMSLRERSILGDGWGAIFRARMAEQVKLIESLPLETAKRVQALSIKAAIEGVPAGVLQRQIAELAGISKDRAKLIARTEVARTQTEITLAQAVASGSTHFKWRTAGDTDVRHAHKILDKTIHRWDKPPIADEQGNRYLPGSGPNCRCVAIAVYPD